MNSAFEAQAPVYDVFLTYARVDKDFAARLQRLLQAYRVPVLSRLRPRRLRVFRDETDAAETRLSEALKRTLEHSRTQVVLCSPASRDRWWVDQEIRHFAQKKSADNIIPILIAGRPNSEAVSIGLSDEAAFPPALLETLGEEPWAPDFRSVNFPGVRIARNQTAWFHLLARLYGTTRHVIERRERARTLTRGFTAALVVLAVTGAAFEYRKVQAESESRALADRANKLDPAKNEEAIRVGITAVEQAPTDEAKAALRAATIQRIQSLRQLVELRPTSDVTIDSAGQTIAVASPLGLIRVWRTRGSETYDVCGTFGPLTQATMSPDGSKLVWFDGSRNKLAFWDTVARTKVEFPSGFRDGLNGSIRFSPNSKAIASSHPVDGGSLWSASDGKRIAALEPEYGNTVTFSSNGELFAQHAENFLRPSRKLAVRQIHDAAIRHTIEDVTGPVKIVRFSADSHKLLALSEGEPPDFKITLLLLDIQDGSLQRLEPKAFDFRELLILEPRSFNRTDLRGIFEARLRDKHPKLIGKYGLTELLLAQKNSIAVAIGRKGDLQPHAFTFEPVTLKLNPPLADLKEELSDPALSPDGSLLADINGPVWDTATGARLWQIPKRFHSIVFSPDGGRLLGVVRRETLGLRIGATVVAYESRSGRELAAFVPDPDDLALEGDKEPPLDLLHIDLQGRQAIIRSAHAAYAWDIDEKKWRRLDGPFKAQKEQLEAHLKALRRDLEVNELKRVARALLMDCP
jgi:WD40 repeat protein